MPEDGERVGRGTTGPEGVRLATTRRRVLRTLPAAAAVGLAGCSSVLGGGSGPAPDWEYEVGGTVASPPALAGGRVLVGGGDRALHAVDAADGERRLRVETGGIVDQRPVVSPTGSDGTPTVQVPSRDGDLYGVALDDGVDWHVEGHTVTPLVARAGSLVVRSTERDSPDGAGTTAYDAATGDVEWRQPTGVHEFASAADHAVVATHDPRDRESHRLVAVRTGDGAVAWRAALPRRWHTVSATDDLVVTGETDAGDLLVQARGASDGETRWYRGLDGEASYGPDPWFGSHVYLAVDVDVGDGRRVVALDRETGEKRWQRDSGWVEAGTADGEATYYVRMDETPKAVAVGADGEHRWTTELDLEDAGNLLVAGSTLLVAGIDRVYALDVETGEKLWRYHPGDTQTRIATTDDTVFVSHADEGRVVALPL